MCCLPPLHNIKNSLLCVQLALFTLLIVMVTCQLVSFSGHLYHMSSLDLDMADVMAFLVFYN